MKHCPYCETDYSLSDIKCPSCGAVDSEYKCNNCGDIHKEAICPKCGLGINETLSICQKCGHKTNERVCPKCGHDAASTMKGAAASVASKAACTITGHTWLGCKCTRCGEVRDTEHRFKSVMGKCEQKCSVCGRTESVSHQWEGSRCARCGANRNIVLRVWNQKNNRPMIGLGVISVIMFVVLGVMQAIENRVPAGEISMPADSADFIGENYQAVANMLLETGFINIKGKPLEDMITGWLVKEGEIDEVLIGGIGGDTEFTTGSSYPKDVEIVLSYHSFPPKENTTQSGVETSAIGAPPVAVSSESSPIEESANEIIFSNGENYTYEGAAYEVPMIERGITIDQYDIYWVLTSGFDYSTDDYKDQVKAIVADVIHNAKTVELIVNITTDIDVIEVETNLDSPIEHGQDWYKQALEKEGEHWIAWYQGGDPTGYQSDESIEQGIVPFEFTWFIAEQTERDDGVFESWQPEAISAVE